MLSPSGGNREDCSILLYPERGPEPAFMLENGYHEVKQVGFLHDARNGDMVTLLLGLAMRGPADTA